MNKTSSGELPLTATLLVSFAFFYIFLMANTLNLNVDDTSTLYSIPPADLFHDHASNRRFVTAILCAFWSRTGGDYYHRIGLWSLLFSASIFYLAFEIARYLKLGLAAATWIAVAAAAHGFMAELYSFTMGYLNYVGALVGAGMIIAGLRLLDTSAVAAYAIAIVGALLCLGSYQPFIVLPPIIFIIGEIMPSAKKNDARIPLRPIVLVLTSLTIGLVVTAIFGHIYAADSARHPSISALVKNIPELFLTFFKLYFSGANSYGLLLPIHERIAYFGITALFIIVAAARSFRVDFLAAFTWALYACGLFILLCGPFNALLPLYWPSARSLSYLAFVGPTMIALLIFRLDRDHPNFGMPRRYVFCAAVAFCALSVANQLSLYYDRYLQRNADIGLAQSIIADLRTVSHEEHTDLAKVPVAVQSTWENYAQRPTVFFDYGLSTFSAMWSNTEVLRAVSGLKFPSFVPNAKDCPTSIDDYAIRRVKQGWLVCLK